MLILAWHNVNGTWCFPSPPGSGYRGLKRQLRLVRRLFNVVSLEPALQRLTAGDPLPARAVAVTFDDGYRDNLELALPLLTGMELPATFFLVPGLLSGDVDPWWEVVSWAVIRGRASSLDWEESRLPLDSAADRKAALRLVTQALKRRDGKARDQSIAGLVEHLRPEGLPPGPELFLDWKHAAGLVRAGFDIGSHTYSHVILSEETPDLQRRELAESRRVLQQELAVPISALAYPNGTRTDYAPATIAAAAQAGYSYALTTEDGWNEPDSPPYELRRFVMYPERGIQGFSALTPAAKRAGQILRRAGRSRSPGLHRIAS